MKPIQFAFILGAALIVIGCNADSTAIQTVPAKAPAKGSQSEAIQNNPKLPEAAKRGIMGSQGGPQNGK